MYSRIIQTIVLSVLLFSASAQGVFNEKLVNENSLYFANKIAQKKFMADNTEAVDLQKLYYFDSLYKYSNEQELIELTNHLDAKVRCYAFRGLLSLRSKSIGAVIRKNKNDTAEVYYKDHCIIAAHTVISQMAFSISSRQMGKLDTGAQAIVVSIIGKNTYY